MKRVGAHIVKGEQEQAPQSVMMRPVIEGGDSST